MHSLPTGDDPKGTRRRDPAAMAVNAHWAVVSNRLEREAARQAAADKLARRLPVIVDDFERRLEHLEAAIFELTQLVDERREAA